MANQYVVGSKDVQGYFKFDGIPAIKVETGSTFNLTYNQSVQEIFAIGSVDPIAVSETNAQYTASLTLQTGEMQLVLDAINAAADVPYATIQQVPAFTFSKTVALRNSAIPKTVTESLLGCKIESVSSDTDRNNVETLTTLTLRAVGVQRTVVPIA